MKAKIHVTLKQGILDPQGKAIEHALDSLGFKNAANVRVGKYMELDVSETDKAKAEVLWASPNASAASPTARRRPWQETSGFLRAS